MKRRSSNWREMLERLDGMKSEEDAIEAIGALRELLAMSICSPASCRTPCCSAVGIRILSPLTAVCERPRRRASAPAVGLLKERAMHGLIYLIGLIVVILFILSFLGLR